MLSGRARPRAAPAFRFLDAGRGGRPEKLSSTRLFVEPVGRPSRSPARNETSRIVDVLPRSWPRPNEARRRDVANHPRFAVGAGYRFEPKCAPALEPLPLGTVHFDADARRPPFSGDVEASRRAEVRWRAEIRRRRLHELTRATGGGRGDDEEAANIHWREIDPVSCPLSTEGSLSR